MKEEERMYEAKIDMLNKKVASLMKEVAALSKTSRRLAGKEAKNDNNHANVAKDSGGSGTDSPSTNWG